MNEEILTEIASFMYNRYRVKEGIDGWSHIQQTVHFGMMIACGEDVSLMLPAAIGCFLHDIGRGREKNGQTHGVAGYDYCTECKDEMLYQFGKYGIMNDVFDVILDAVKFHDKGMTTDILLKGIIWDADRLSLVRFKDKIIAKELLSTWTAKRLIDYAKQYVENI